MRYLDPLPGAIISSSLALLFLTAVAHKVREWRRFLDTLVQYELVPRAAVAGASFLIVAAEALAGVGCLIPDTRRAGVALACLLLIAYAAAMAVNLVRGHMHIDCGCAGFGQRRQISWWMVRRNLLFTALAMPALWPAAQRPFTPVDILMVLFATLAIAGLCVAQVTLAQNRQFLSR